MFKKVVLFILLLSALVFVWRYGLETSLENDLGTIWTYDDEAGPLEPPNSFSIEALLAGEYPGSDLILEQVLPDGTDYRKSIVSYRSEGLQIYALLTVPKMEKPEGGFPAIVFNHGSVPPDQYSTAERYQDYVAYFARRGYVVLKSDYRGHGSSEGEAQSSFYHPGYVIDVLNAVSSLQKHPDVNPQKIGMWGHSSGGHITTMVMILSRQIKAAVIWAGLTASYDETFVEWRNHRRRQTSSASSVASPYRRQSQLLEERYGLMTSGADFWRSISPFNYLSQVSGPIQLHHGTADNIVPLKYAEYFQTKLLEAGKDAELYTYTGADHNLSGVAFGVAMVRSVEFFDKYLK